MKILVSGGAGFIGSQVAQAYVEAGHQVVVLDDLSTGKAENVPAGSRLEQMDIAGPAAAELVAQGGFEVINLHAAQVSVPASVADPLADARSNVLGLINLLQAGARAGVRRVIFISSGGAVYGELPGWPVDETFPARPLSPYAVGKRAGELYLDYFAAHYGLEAVVLRYANVYGPRQVPHAEAGVVAIFMDRLLAGQPVTIYRSPQMPRGMKRDYTFVGDVVRANLAALSKGQGVYNIGTGQATDTLSLWEAVQAAAGRQGDYCFGPVRPGDIAYSALDCAQAAAGLGWKPQHDLAAGLAATWAWRSQQ